MSCIITHKGKKYSEEQFKEYFINNKNEFVTSIAKNKDVIDSFKRKMEGIDFVFSQSPELASIGSKAQYLQYLSTIFKTSKVKDIVYHGADEKIEKFTLDKKKNKKEKGLFFFSKKSSAQLWRDASFEEDNTQQGDLIYALLNLKNPETIDFENKSAWDMAKYANENIKGDGLIAVNVDEMYVGRDTQYAAFKPEQIHILSSKADIQGFKEFVNKNTTQVVDKNQIYSQLGNKTVSNNVVIKSWGELKDVTKAITPQGVVSTRIKNTNEHFGNPFSHDPAGKTQGLIKTETVKEAVEKYIDWVINSQDSRAKWIRKQLQSGELKGKPILYYKELGEPSHATALDYLINKYDWSKNTQQVVDSGIDESKVEDIIEKDYDFKYFGTTYEIETTNGIATDVLSLKQWASETNTKFQERKQKILDAYNDNKDVDKQTGRKFRNLTINEEFHTVEKTPIVEKSESEKKSFTYKGRTIETAFELTDGQSNALKSLIDFSSNSSTTKAITLQGPAGTGKTATIGYLQKYLGGDSKLIYLAPTHAATAELAFATVKTGNKSLPLTAASAFRKGVNKITGEEEALMTKKLLDRLSYGNNILVVDEVSMLNGKDYALILETIKNKPNIKLIFMGDILQIPEVNANNPDKKQVSKAFTEHAQVVLSEVKRTSSNSILQILTNLRKYTNGLIPKVKNTEQVQYVDDNGFDQLIVETFKKDPENSVLISYTNAGVKATNRKIREVLGRTGDLKKDDIITGYLGYSSKQIEKGNIANSIRFKVENVEKDGSEYIITASSEKLKSLRTQGVSGVPTTFSGIYLQLSPSDAFTFDELTDADFEENNKKLSVMMAELHTVKQAAIKNPRMWSTYYDLQTSIGAHLAKVNLGDDYIYNPKTNKMEKYDSNKHSEIDADLKIEKGVDFGHAVTVHKSQGSTFKNVFFDTATLPKGNSSKLYRGEDLISSEKHALIYVAMSRASDLLVVRASDSSLFYDVLERKNMPEVVSQKEIQPDIEETLEHFLPINNKFSKNTLELTKNVLSLFETEDTIENYKNRCK